MIIRQLQPHDCFGAKALWQEVFHDTEPFANFFFSHRFTPTLSFGVFDGDRLVSMALARRVRTAYPAYPAILISGVSTLPAYRHRGLMTETVNRLLDNAKLRNYDLALLSPAIPDLYVPFGFRPLTYAIKVTEPAAEHPEIAETKNASDLYPAYIHATLQHPFMLRRTVPEMRTALDEYTRDNGVFLLAPNRTGYLCFLPDGNGIEITECLADSPAVYRALLEAAASRAPSRLASALLPTDCAMSGTLCRPVHALALKDGIDLASAANDRRTFCVEKY